MCVILIAIAKRFCLTKLLYVVVSRFPTRPEAQRVSLHHDLEVVPLQVGQRHVELPEVMYRLTIVCSAGVQPLYCATTSC